jgi:uncharacterized protein YndB with AHSA1/START domain
MTKPSFVYVTYIRTSPEKLWQALTDGSLTQQYWSGRRVESAWTVGAPVTFWFEGKVSDSGKVLESDPPRRLSYSFHVEFVEALRSEPPSRVTIDIEKLDAQVKLTVTHDEFEPGSKVLEAVSGGWPVILSSLKSLLETGRAIEFPNGSCDARRAKAEA